MEKPEMRLIAVSNRLPIVLTREDEKLTVRPGTGGLVTALAPVLKNRGGTWIGWPGAAEVSGIDETLKSASKNVGYDLRPVTLTEEEVKGYYLGFSNEIIWPLFHGFETRCNFDPEYWRCYRDVNRKFAKAVAENSRESDYIWVHDYHLMNIAHELKSMKVARHTGFFLHIPFPPADMFMKLPWRAEILHGLLQFDLVGFQTLRDRRNFIQCLRNLKYPGLKISGRGTVLKAILPNREVRIGSFPISIDFNGFSRRAESRDVSERGWYFHEAIPDQQIILGIDRLDYTKGILERLEAFRITLRKNREMHGNVTFVQVIVPSREELPEYQNLKARIEQAVTEINGEFTYPGWVPIHHFYRQLEHDELIAYYRAAEIALVMPLRDGMNLVAKEYCACSLEGKGVLILSEFAGAAAELQKGALLVNPYDVKSVVDTICLALDMPPEERRSRMKRLRSIIRKRDIFWWVDSILQTAFAKRLEDFPQAEEYVPEISLKEEC